MNSPVSGAIRNRSIIILLISAVGWAAGQELFIDRSADCGIDRSVSRGIAISDYNQDGLLDVYLCHSTGSSRLYKNTGRNHFVDVTDQIGVGVDELTASADWIDYDNDGDLDLFVSCYWNAPRLYRNDGGQFRDVAAEAGIVTHGRYNSQPAWADYNRDGHIDLFIAVFETEPANFLFKNNGDGTFSDVADKAYVKEPVKARMASWADYNNDSWPDLIVSGQQGCVLYHNDGQGSFLSATERLRLGNTRDGLGNAWGDFDNDGDQDLFMANDGEVSLLLVNSGENSFSLGNARFSSGAPSNSISPLWADFNNDGFLDLYVKHYDAAGTLFLNSKGFSFLNITAESGLRSEPAGCSSAWGDMDNDGDIDLMVTPYGSGPLFYYENQMNSLSGNAHWLDVTLAGSASNRMGLDSKVRLFVNGKMQVRENKIGEGCFVQNSPVLHFGLGNAETVDSLIIVWPSGRRQMLTGLAADRKLEIREPGINAVRTAPPNTPGLSLANYPNPFNQSTTVEITLPSPDTVRIRIFDLSGRTVYSDSVSAISAGGFRFVWDGTDLLHQPLPSGIFICQIETKRFVKSAKLILSR